MKYIKKFENYWEREKEEKEQKRKDNIELAREIFAENPMSKEHDLYMFVGRDEFKEDEDGKYTKTLEIENMVKITPEDVNTVEWGLGMRAIFQGGNVYHIWLPKEIEDLVSGRGSGDIEPWLINLIDQHKQRIKDVKDTKLDVKQRLQDIKQRREDTNKFNL
jgi:hypothetical protein